MMKESCVASADQVGRPQPGTTDNAQPSWDLDALYRILGETTVQLRKGAVFEGSPELVAQAQAGADELTGGGVLEIYMMPPVSAAPDTLERVDVEFMVIGVDKARAEIRRAELTALLNAYPEPDQLAGGPSYIAVGATIGDQGAAFQLFALGKALGLWDVITPAKLGFSGAEARQMAGMGWVMITGYRPKASQDGGEPREGGEAVRTTTNPNPPIPQDHP